MSGYPESIPHVKRALHLHHLRRHVSRGQGDIKALVAALKAAGAAGSASNLAITVDGKLPADFARRGLFAGIEQMQVKWHGVLSIHWFYHLDMYVYIHIYI